MATDTQSYSWTFWGPPTFELLADLDDDGTPETDIWGEVRANPGIHTTRGMDGTRIVSPPVAGVLRAVGDNRQKQLAPSTGFRQGRRVALNETGVFDGTAREVWSGILDDPTLISGKFDAVVRFSAFGTLSVIATKQVSTPLLEDATTDECLDALFDALGIDESLRDFDEGQTTLPQWWLGGQSGPENAFQAMLALLYTEGPGAQIYEEPDGTIRFRNRHGLIQDARSTTAQAHFGDGTTMSPFSLSYEAGRKDTFNYAEIATVRRGEETLAEVWAYGSTITLSADETRVIDAALADPVKDAEAPNTSDGDFTVDTGSVDSVTLGRDSGGIIPIEITAGSGGATISGLRLRAVALPVVSSTVVRTHGVDPNALDEPRTWNRPVRREIPEQVAQDIVNTIPLWYRFGRPTVTFTLQGTNPDKIEEQLSREIGDRIAITDGPNELEGAEFTIASIEHSLNQFLLTTTIQAETAIASGGYAAWGEGAWDEEAWGW